jgi:hypothetical protein
MAKSVSQRPISLLKMSACQKVGFNDMTEHTNPIEDFDGEEHEYWDAAVHKALMCDSPSSARSLLRIMQARLKHKEQVIQKCGKRIQQLKMELKDAYEEVDELTQVAYGDNSLRDLDG